MLSGVFTALVTPFEKNGRLDEAGFIKVLEHQLNGGVDGVVVLGTTGESPTITPQERKRLIEIAVHTLKGSASVWVGTGSASTQEAIEKTLEAKSLGADGALVITPYYNKPTQEGLFQHFKAIAQASNLALMIYNIQGRTSVNLETPTLERLAAIDEIVAVKESSGNLNQIMDVIQAMPKGFSVLSGDDQLTLPIMALGGVGVVSVLSNVLPKDVKELTRLMTQGNYAEARKLHYGLLSLTKALFIETNPAPVKTLMAELGLCSSTLRLPMVPLSDANLKKVQACLEETLQLQP